jgi:hypothetical protein
MTARFAVAALLLAAAAAESALADGVSLPPLTSKKHHFVMTHNDATTTSKCVGDTQAPMCAIETLLACFVRSNLDLCAISLGMPQDRLPDFGPHSGWPAQIYWVVRSEVLTDKHFPWRPKRDVPWRPTELDMRAGDVRIDLVRRECEPTVSPSTCHPPRYGPTGPTAYIVRQQAGRWVVIIWGDY